MQGDILKGAALGVAVMSVSLAALSLIDPRQPQAPEAHQAAEVNLGAAQTAPEPVAAPEQHKDAPAPDAGQIAQAGSEAPATHTTLLTPPKLTAAPIERLREEASASLPPSTAPVATGQSPQFPQGGPDGAPQGAEPVPSEPTIVAVVSPEALAENEAALRGLKAEAPPVTARAAVVLPRAADIPAPGPKVHLGPALLMQMPEGEALAAPTLPPLGAATPRRETPLLPRPAMELGLPAPDPAGLPPAIQIVAYEALIGEDDAHWLGTGGEAELNLPELREAPPPVGQDFSLKFQPSPQTVHGPLNTPPLAEAPKVAEQAIAGPSPEARISQPPATLGPIAPISEAELAAETTVMPEAAAVDPAQFKALRRYAARASAPMGQPLLSVLLLDDGTSGLDALDLAALPYHFSIVIPSARVGAAEAIRSYRELGHEVVLMTPLPDLSSPKIAADALINQLKTAPEVIAVVEESPHAFSASQDHSVALAAALSEEGQGLVLWKPVPNPVEGFSAENEPPIVDIYRDIDGRGQDARAILRFLEEAAARAAQRGSVVVFGRLQPETLQALNRWQSTPRAAKVGLVPASVILLGE